MDFERSYDHLAVSKMEEPYDLVAEARTTCPVTYSDQYGGFWVLFRYCDVSAAARNPEVFASSHGSSIPPHGLPVAIPPIEIDPPEHIQYRAPLLERFSPRSMAKLEPDVRQLVTDLIDAFIGTGKADLVAALAVPVPAGVITHLLSIPSEDQAKFHDWATRLMQVTNDLDAVMELMAHLAGVYEDRKISPRDPTDDIPTLLQTIQINGEPLSQEQFLAMMAELLTAGLDTTANSTALILELLSERRDLRQALIDDPTLIPSAIEEFLRYLTPLPILSRTATRTTEIDTVEIQEGNKVQLNWLSANHDPAEFPDPEEIQLDRNPNRHYAFGTGPHRCLGSHLARIELKVVLEEVLQRLPDYEVDGPGVVRYAGITRGIAALPATFSPGPRIG